MMPFDAYRCYLSLKNHFTKDHYDYYKNEGRTRVKKETFYKREISQNVIHEFNHLIK